MTTQHILVLHGVALVLLGGAVYFTRATWRRVAGAMAAGVTVGLFCFAVDILGNDSGWWRYTTVDTPYGPLWMYTLGGLWYGAGVALIGWRVTRRFGSRGLVAFIAFMAVYGPLRDYAGSAASGLFAMEPGIVPLLADAACWAAGMALAQAAMRLVAGPADKDPWAWRPKFGMNVFTKEHAA
jgi:hypothetical protein